MSSSYFNITFILIREGGEVIDLNQERRERNGISIKKRCMVISNLFHCFRRLFRSNTKNPIAAHALSFDRLEIVYGSYETEIISPKNKEQFINLVKSKNPHIEIK